MASANGGLRIGLSGWSYPVWRQGFYKGVPQRRWLAHCAEHFDTVEVNATFYRAMKPEIFARWHDETPKDFAFAIKGHRFITHIRRLAGVTGAVARQRTQCAPLGAKLSAVLWQLPASLQADAARLVDFARILDDWPGVRHAIEFRHRSWFGDRTRDVLAAHGIANCLSDAPRWPMWDAVTADPVYVRLHGHSRIYASRYSDRLLRQWAARISGWQAEGRAVHVYFDNDADGHAPFDALRLKALVSPSIGLKRSSALGVKAVAIDRRSERQGAAKRQNRNADQGC